MRPVERAQEEIDKGRLWRAKDILSGSLATSPYEVTFYRTYGELFLRMGDLRQAGRFLFLSGSRNPDHLESIDLFLSQFKKSHKNELYAAFPSRARLSKLSDYPPPVAEELRKKGFTEIIRHPAAPPVPKTIWEKISKGSALTFFFILFVLLAVGILRGIYVGAEMISGWVFRLFFK